MTDTQKKLARHALGLPNKTKTSYRNRFCIGPGGDGYEEWRGMVEAGEAVERKGTDADASAGTSAFGGDSMFFLTLKGGLAARLNDEHLSREEAQEMRRIDEIEARKAAVQSLNPPVSQTGAQGQDEVSK